MQSVLNEPLVMLFDGTISTAAELVPVLTKANAENSSLLLVAHDFGDEALATLIVNKMRGIVKVCAVKAPDFGDRRTLALEDMAVLTGGTVISKDKGFKLDKMTAQQITPMLGRCRTANIGKEKTTIVDGKGEVEAIEQRAEEIKHQIDNAQSMFEREKLQERLGKLVGGVAVISVGGNSEIEIKEKKDRVEDALYATKAALAEGIVAGGGVALYNAQKELSITNIGHKIVSKACLAPFKTILSNAGIEDYYRPLSKLNSENKTFNAKTMEVVDAFEAGIIDPVKVTRTAIENAVSVAGTILTTESVVFEKKEEKKSESNLDF
jgi:chaperonin GroEL